jgi:hypothetical protein
MKTYTVVDKENDRFMKSLLRQVKSLSTKYDYNPCFENPQVQHVRDMFKEVDRLVDAARTRDVTVKLHEAIQAMKRGIEDGLAREFLINQLAPFIKAYIVDGIKDLKPTA